MTPAAALHAVIDRHRQPGDRVYAIADSARDWGLAWAAFERFGLDRWSLFPAGTAEHMGRVAPYLIPVPFGSKYPYPQSGYLDMWAARLGGSAGVLLTAAPDHRALWEHLRNLFQVEDEGGREYFFRYYDPRVLRSFLPTVAGGQVREFFGPVRGFFVEGRPGEVLVCRPTATATRIDPVPL